MDSFAVIAEAQSWLGTPFVHQGDVKGVGTDCVMLNRACYMAGGVLPADFLDPRPYPRGWYLGVSRYLETLRPYFDELPPSTPPLPADLVLFRRGRDANHGVLVVDWPLVIHADDGSAAGEGGEVCYARALANALSGRPLLKVLRARG